jgi:hypothetical protein
MKKDSNTQLRCVDDFFAKLDHSIENFAIRTNTARNSRDIASLMDLLVEMWQLWVASDKIARDRSFTFPIRRRAAVGCELLISFRYQIVKGLDVVIEGVIHE